MKRYRRARIQSPSRTSASSRGRIVRRGALSHASAVRGTTTRGRTNPVTIGVRTVSLTLSGTAYVMPRARAASVIDAAQRASSSGRERRTALDQAPPRLGLLRKAHANDFARRMATAGPAPPQRSRTTVRASATPGPCTRTR